MSHRVTIFIVEKSDHFEVHVRVDERLVEILDGGSDREGAEAMVDDIVRMGIDSGGKRVQDPPV